MSLEVKKIFTGGILSSNVFLVKNKEESILVDTSRKQHTQDILDGIKKEGLEYEDISHLVITHTHFDHVEGVVDLKKKLVNAKVIVHDKEAGYLKDGKSVLNISYWLIRIVVHFLTYLFGYLNYQGYDADIKIKERYEINEHCYILPTPGHSIGSISLVIGDVAIVGDSIYNKWGRYWIKSFFFYENYKLASKQWKILKQSGCKTFYTGHGNVLQNVL